MYRIQYNERYIRSSHSRACLLYLSSVVQQVQVVVDDDDDDDLQQKAQ